MWSGPNSLYITLRQIIKKKKKLELMTIQPIYSHLLAKVGRSVLFI